MNARFLRLAAAGLLSVFTVTSTAHPFDGNSRNAQRDNRILIKDFDGLTPADRPIIQPAFKTDVRRIQRIKLNRRRFAAAKRIRVTMNNAVGGRLTRASRGASQRLARAQRHFDEKKYSDALQLLQTIVEGTHDGFIENNSANANHNEARLRSLKAEALAMIGRIANSDENLYERLYGQAAAEQLKTAVQTGNWNALREVTGRYYHTAAGTEALYRIGADFLDRGEPVAAARCFERIRKNPQAARRWEPLLSLRTAVAWYRAGKKESAEKLLSAIKKAAGGHSLSLAGAHLSLDGEPEQILVRLEAFAGRQKQPTAARSDEWRMLCGSASRSSVQSPAIHSEKISWRAETVFDPIKIPGGTEPTPIDGRLKGEIQRISRRFLSRGGTLLPRLHPILVNETVLVRSVGTLQALDARSGKRKWQTMADETLEHVLTAGAGKPLNNNPRALSLLVGQRVLGDMAYGTLSSDGRLVFCVEDLGFSHAAFARRTRRAQQPNLPHQPSTRPAHYNRLAAYNLKNGKLAWEIGGPRGEWALRSPETFFTSAPLPVSGHLFCLAEREGAVMLLVLNASDGALVWSQPLVDPETDIRRDVHRRIAGATASYADGVIVCPTATGAVVAVDPITRTLLWGRQLVQSEPLVRNGPLILPGVAKRLRRRPRPQTRAAWIDSVAIIADGKVVTKPRGSEEIHCFDLFDGRLLWKQPREDGMYIAGASNSKVIVVGSRSVRAFQLDSGRAAWPKPVAIRFPSGRGIIREQQLLVPLTSAQIATINLTTGRLVAKTRTPRGLVAGNLIGYRGTLISQGIDSLDAFALPPAGRSIAGKFQTIVPALFESTE